MNLVLVLPSSTDAKYLLKMFDISRGSFVVLLSYRCVNDDTTVDFFLLLLIRLLIPFQVFLMLFKLSEKKA